MRTYFESDKYKFNYDSHMGVGNFERVCDGMQSDLETGSDCSQLIGDLEAMETAARPFNELFDGLASEYSFTN